MASWSFLCASARCLCQRSVAPTALLVKSAGSGVSAWAAGVQWTTGFPPSQWSEKQSLPPVLTGVGGGRVPGCPPSPPQQGGTSLGAGTGGSGRGQRQKKRMACPQQSFPCTLLGQAKCAKTGGIRNDRAERSLIETGPACISAERHRDFFAQPIHARLDQA